MTMIPYLKTFFEEKDLDLDICWTFQDKSGKWNWIGPAVVIEHIAIAPVEEQEKIALVIRHIDYTDGDVNLFLKHLAGVLING